MNFIIVGCGRVGAELCYHLFKRGHQVVVVDINKDAFNRLHPDFRGRTSKGKVWQKVYWKGQAFTKRMDLQR